jgi:LacI family transcriptional regulator
VRWRSLRDAAADLGLQTRRIGPYRPSVPGGEQAATDFVRKPSTAILAYNDQLAIGIIRGLTATGTVVPDDVSIIGFDNIFAADLVTPRLTTIAAPLHALGGTAVHNLLAIINGARSRAAEPMVLPTKLVERASTARRRRGRPLSRPAASSAVVAPAGTR